MAALCLLASCATLPTARPPAEPWGLLAADADLYLYAEVPAVRGLLEPLAAGLVQGDAEDLRPLLDRAERAYAAVRLPPGGPRSVELALTGRLPAGMVTTRLSLSCAWVRHESLPPYWRGRSRPLEVSAPRSGLVLAASGPAGSMQRLLGRWLEPGPGLAGASEEGVPELLRGAGVYAQLPPPASAGGLPIRRLWLAGFPGPEGLRVSALLLLEGEANARALQNLVRLLAAALLRGAGLEGLVPRLRGLEITAAGGAVRVEGLTLSPSEVEALLAPLIGGRGGRGGN